MWILFMFVGFLSIIIAGTGYTNYVGREMSADNRENAAYIAKYHTFNHVAAIYWRANPNTTGSFCWNTLKLAPGVPATLSAANIQPYEGKTWRMLASGNNGYVLCAEMPETARALAQIEWNTQCSTQTTCS